MAAKNEDIRNTANENVQRLVIWLDPSLVRRMDGWLADDNCKNRSEFISKALRFYMGYLSTEDTSEYLSKTLVTTIQGTLADNSNRLRSMLFKWCVELDMVLQVAAKFFDVSEVNLRALRKFAVEHVKRTNGQISLDQADEQQNRRANYNNKEWRE